MVRVALVLLALLLVAGCGVGIGGFDGLTGPETGPFAHPPGKAPPLVTPVPDGGGIVVHAIAGAPEPAAGALRRAMVNALADQEIPAVTSGGNLRSRYLQGFVGAVPHGAATVRLQIAWALTDPAGKPVGSKTVTRDVPVEAWDRADPATIKAIAGASAPIVAAMVQGSMPAATDRVRRLPVHVWPVVGVSQIDALALRRAMEHALKERDYDVRPQLADNGFVITGNVVLGQVKAGQQPVRISWAVLDSTGKELGRLSQDNTLAVGSGPPSLAGLASDIAEAAADGVADVIDNLPPGYDAPKGQQNGAGSGSKSGPAKTPATK